MEHSFIAWLKQRCLHLPQPRVGIGDDCAVLNPPKNGHVVTTDTLCEGVHFRVAECGPRAVGRKLMGVNLSDLASMCAEPASVFLTVCVPREPIGEWTSGTLGAEIVEGVRDVCEAHSIQLAGGDTNVWDGGLVASLTAVGLEPDGGCWLRSGGSPGDVVFVSGELGGSILGKHLNVQPRLELAKSIRDLVHVTAATDVSDGLGIDLLNIFTASKCGAVIDRDKIPVANDARELSNTSGKSPLEHAMGDGEDFELLFTVAPDDAPKVPAEIGGVKLTAVGELINRTGLWTQENGRYTQITPLGYIHR